MPDQIRNMRLAPRMLMRVIAKEEMPAVEEEYQKIKKQYADKGE